MTTSEDDVSSALKRHSVFRLLLTLVGFEEEREGGNAESDVDDREVDEDGNPIVKVWVLPGNLSRTKLLARKEVIEHYVDNPLRPEGKDASKVRATESQHPLRAHHHYSVPISSCGRRSQGRNGSRENGNRKKRRPRKTRTISPNNLCGTTRRAMKTNSSDWRLSGASAIGPLPKQLLSTRNGNVQKP